MNKIDGATKKYTNNKNNPDVWDPHYTVDSTSTVQYFLSTFILQHITKILVVVIFG